MYINILIKCTLPAGEYRGEGGGVGKQMTSAATFQLTRKQTDRY